MPPHSWWLHGINACCKAKNKPYKTRSAGNCPNAEWWCPLSCDETQRLIILWTWNFRGWSNLNFDNVFSTLQTPQNNSEPSGGSRKNLKHEKTNDSPRHCFQLIIYRTGVVTILCPLGCYPFSVSRRILGIQKRALSDSSVFGISGKNKGICRDCGTGRE